MTAPGACRMTCGQCACCNDHLHVTHTPTLNPNPLLTAATNASCASWRPTWSTRPGIRPTRPRCPTPSTWCTCSPSAAAPTMGRGHQCRRRSRRYVCVTRWARSKVNRDAHPKSPESYSAGPRCRTCTCSSPRRDGPPPPPLATPRPSPRSPLAPRPSVKPCCPRAAAASTPASRARGRPASSASWPPCWRSRWCVYQWMTGICVWVCGWPEV